jgi:hypothetical protein
MEGRQQVGGTFFLGRAAEMRCGLAQSGLIGVPGDNQRFRPDWIRVGRRFVDPYLRTPFQFGVARLSSRQQESTVRRR